MVCDQCAGYDITDDCPCCQREPGRFDLLGIEDSVIELMTLVNSGEVDHIDQIRDNLPQNLAEWQEELVIGEITGKFPHLTE